MTATAGRTRHRFVRRAQPARLLGGSLIAIAAGLMAPPALAQNALQGSHATQSGTVSFGGSPGVDLITVSSNQAVINWVPNDAAITGGTINFLPNGSRVTFVNNASLGNDFTVLNRVLPASPTRAIGLNGIVQTRFEDLSGGLSPGGGVWFYSPGGIVVGATAQIDVGRLALTTADPVRDSGGDFIDLAGSSQFLAANSASQITIAAGATITATPENSYVVMVAPYVVQSGSVDVNGTAAYIAAEAATLTIDDGLVTVEVTQGTDGNLSGQALLHNGTTTGPASSGPGDSHRIYMVAVPKNTAITALVASGGGSLGFDIAGAADVQGNAIVLSAGQDVDDTLFTPNPTGTGDASFTVQGTRATSAIYGRATTGFDLLSGLAGMTYAAPVVLSSGTLTQVNATIAGAGLQFDAGLDIRASNVGAANGGDATGGTVSLLATGAGATVTVNGDLLALADGVGGDNLSGTGRTGNGIGGTSQLLAQAGGVITVNGDVTLSANGLGGLSGTAGVAGGNGTGGLARILTTGINSTVIVTGDSIVDASGFGTNGFGCLVCTQDGGTGTGGTVNIHSGGSAGSLLDLQGAVDVTAIGQGGFGLTAAPGNGTGGTGTIRVGDGATVSVDGQVVVDVGGDGGDYLGSGAFAGGVGQGGTAGLSPFTTGGTASLGSGYQAIASGFGGNGGSAPGAIAGNGFGGTAQLLTNQAGDAFSIAGNLLLDASAFGGDTSALSGVGGNAIGGTAGIFSNAGTVFVGGVSSFASSAFGGIGTTASLAQGGTASVAANGPANLTLHDLSTDAGGLGGGNLTGAGTTGSARGGITQIVTTGFGSVTVNGSASLGANGLAQTGGAGTDGGDGTGGSNVSISQGSGGTVAITGDATVSASGFGGGNMGGGDLIAGTGAGGDARIVVNNSTITIGGLAIATADGLGGAGGDSGTAGSGGAGIGGLANLGSTVGTLTVGGEGRTSAAGTGGDAGFSGSGGQAVGGQALIGTIPSGGALLIGGDAFADGRAQGGSAIGTGFTGGSATGGVAQAFGNGGTVSIGGTTLLLSGGNGGNAALGANAGSGLGGLSSIIARTATGNVTLGDTLLSVATGTSGSVTSGGGNGAAATGGDAAIVSDVDGSAITINGSIQLDGRGIGGAIQSGTAALAAGGSARISSVAGDVVVQGAAMFDASGAGSANAAGSGGAGRGGQANLVVNGAGTGSVTIAGSLTAIADGTGGAGSGAGASGGAGTGGSASFRTVLGTATIQAVAANLSVLGTGGTGNAGANAGGGSGGVGQIVALSGAVQINGAASVAANGASGEILSGLGNGANATGGDARIGSFAATGTLNVAGSAVTSAAATGGAVRGGAPGSAQGGTAVIAAGAGVIAIGGSAQANSLATGSSGIGSDGGGAFGGVAFVGTGPDAFVSGGGSATLTVGGSAVAVASGTGGQATGTGVNGGNATGGFARLTARDGAITLGGGGGVVANADGGSVTGSGNGGDALSGNATILADNGNLQINGTVSSGVPAIPNVGAFAYTAANGGAGAGGGSGGDASAQTVVVNGGELGAQIVTLNSTFGPARIAMQSTIMASASIGGRGGDGLVGGAGGSATGGSLFLLGSAGNGTIAVGLTVLQASGTGGAGGTGTTQGGAGGTGLGGSALYGTQSGAAIGSSTGSATMGNVIVNTPGIGGAGGAGGASGVGGAGGDGNGGSNALLVRGTPVTLGNVTAQGDGRGGNGGAGATIGLGGDALSGSSTISITQASQGPLRSTVTGGTFTGTAGAIGGTGSIGGAGQILLASDIFIRQSDATFAAINLSAPAAGGVGAGGVEGAFHIENATLNVANALSQTTGGNLSVLVESGSVNAASVTLSGLNFVPDPVIANPVAPGTISAGLVNLTSTANLIASANFTTSDPITIVAPGIVRTGGLTSGGAISVTAQGAITMGALSAIGGIALESLNGTVSFASAVAGSNVDLGAAGSLTGGAVTSGDSITASSGAGITLGALSAGLVNPSPAPGATYNIGIAANANVQVASAAAAASIGLISQTGSVTSGSITAARNVLVLAGSDITLGNVTGGTGAADHVYLANSSLFPLGGPIDAFNPAPIFAATPVRIGGSLALGGTVSGGNILAASLGGTAFTGDLTGSQRIVVDSGAIATFGGLVSAPTISITSSNLSLGAGGRLGTAATTSLSLVANNTAGVIVGGTAQPTGQAYQLDADEAKRVQAQAIAINGGAVEIRDVTLLGSAAPSAATLAGANGRLSVSAATEITVTGKFAVDQMANGNSVSLSAQRVSVATDQGSVLLSGSSPGGILNITANAIHVARQSLLTQLVDDVNFAGRDAALGAGTGAGTATLQARQINLTARNSLLIQNNGTASAFAGFNSNLGGVSVTNAGFVPGQPASSTLLDVVVYGRQVDAVTGSVTSDQSLRDQVIAPLRLGEFTIASSVNGCLLSAASCESFGEDVAGIIAPGIKDQGESDEEERREEGTEAILAKANSVSPIQPPVTIVDTQPLTELPALDDPITGGGNPSLSGPTPPGGVSGGIQP